MSNFESVIAAMDSLIARDPNREWTIKEIQDHHTERTGKFVYRTTISKHLKHPSVAKRLMGHHSIPDPIYLHVNGITTWNGLGNTPDWCETDAQKAEAKNRLLRSMGLVDASPVVEAVAPEPLDIVERDINTQTAEVEFRRPPQVLLDEVAEACSNMREALASSDDVNPNDLAYMKRYGQILTQIGLDLDESVKAYQAKMDRAQSVVDEMIEKNGLTPQMIRTALLRRRFAA
jgi:hypothetical protein